MDVRAMTVAAMLAVAYSLPFGDRRSTLIASACAMNTAGVYSKELDLMADVWRPYERIARHGASQEAG